MNVVIVIYYILFFICLIYGLYFAISGYIGAIKRNKVKFKKASKTNNFAILIPARNEESVIKNLIDSLKNQNYPKDNFTIYVIPNNCTDKTKEVALENGAKVIECTVPTKTKGDVLKFVFDKLKNNKKIDAYLIFDADNIVHPDFIKHMNDCLESGYRVAEGFRDAKNPSDNWISGSYTLFYLFQNIFFNRSRMALKGSASINGTGFMLKKDLIDEMGFNTFTLTEDVEFSGQCALKGEKIAFVEKAVTFDEYPTKFIPSWKQRKRWSAGNLECMRLYSFKLLVNAFKNKSYASFDMGLVYLGPLIQVLGFIDFIMLICFRIFGIELHDIFAYAFANQIVFFIATYLLGVLIEVIILLWKKKRIFSVISGIILFPLFILSWIPINIVCLIKKQTKWEVIKHDRNVNIDDVLKK